MAATVLGVTSRLSPPREKAGRERDSFCGSLGGVRTRFTIILADFSLWLAGQDRVTCPLLKLSLIDTG